jgi:hypothetical protein
MMAEAGDVQDTRLNMIALVRADGSHVPGNLILDKHIDQLTAQIQLTRACLEGSTDMEALLGAGFTLINGAHCSSTCIMATIECGTTAKALLLRYRDKCFKVIEEGQSVAYKAQDGEAWYLAAEQKGALKKGASRTFAIVIRGLPNATSNVEFYTRLLENHFGSLAKPVTANGHEFGGVKTDYSDGSLTFICNDEKRANTACRLPLVINGMELGNLDWSKRQASICGKTVCKDPACLGIDEYHIDGCARTDAEKRSKIDKSVAINKAFSKKMQDNAKQIGGVRTYMDTKYGGIICRGFNQKGIPCKPFCCTKGPCRDWEELLETTLAKTIYADMPESIRRGSARARGGRAGRKKQEAKRCAVNSESEELSGEEGGC